MSAVLTERVRAIHAESDATYGMARVHAELLRPGMTISRTDATRLSGRCSVPFVHCPFELRSRLRLDKGAHATKCAIAKGRVTTPANVINQVLRRRLRLAALFRFDPMQRVEVVKQGVPAGLLVLIAEDMAIS